MIVLGHCASTRRRRRVAALVDGAASQAASHAAHLAAHVAARLVATRRAVHLRHGRLELSHHLICPSKRRDAAAALDALAHDFEAPQHGTSDGKVAVIAILAAALIVGVCRATAWRFILDPLARSRFLLVLHRRLKAHCAAQLLRGAGSRGA